MDTTTTTTGPDRALRAITHMAKAHDSEILADIRYGLLLAMTITVDQYVLLSGLDLDALDWDNEPEEIESELRAAIDRWRAANPAEAARHDRLRSLLA